MGLVIKNIFLGLIGILKNKNYIHADKRYITVFLKLSIEKLSVFYNRKQTVSFAIIIWISVYRDFGHFYPP